MAVIMSEVALSKILDLYLNGSGSSIVGSWRLYSNDYTPVPGMLVGAFTEVTASGYAPVSVLDTGWTLTLAGTGLYDGTNDAIAFTMDEAVTVYGYYVLDGDGDVAWAQRFATPVVLPSFGGTITLQPRLELKTPLA